MNGTQHFPVDRVLLWQSVVKVKDDELAALKNKLVAVNNELAALKAAKNDVGQCIHPIFLQ